MHIVHRRPAPDVRAQDVPAILTFVAGARAPHVAALFPAPSVAYLTAPAHRRHLIHLVVDAWEEADFAWPVHRLAHDLEFVRADAVAAHWLDGAPPGFLRALSRIGEAPWTPEHYRMLRTMLAEPGAGVVLRASAEIDVTLLRRLAVLAPDLRIEAIVRRVPALDDARLLTEAYDALVWRLGAHARGVVARWRRAEDAERLFAMAAEDVTPADFPLALYPEHEHFVRLDTRRALTEAGRRFQNCLGTYALSAASGRVALYTWAGPPVAAVELARDAVFGWRLEQVRGQDNTLLDVEHRAPLRAALAEMGVWNGRWGEDLIAALQERAQGRTARLAAEGVADQPFTW